MSRLISKMHGRRRSELRTKISAAVANRERLYQEGKLGRVIKSVLGTESNRFDYDSLQTPEGIITEPTAVHNKVASHFQDWFEGPTEFNTGIHANSNWQEIFTDEEAFKAHAVRQAIPTHLSDILWKAVKAPYTHPGMAWAQEKMREALTEAPTFGEFWSAICASSAGSSAGISGLSYNMLKKTPEPVLRDIFDTLVLLWPSKAVPDWWQWRVLAAVPKVPDSNSLDHIRPIMLTECLRKIWTIIPLRKIQRIWEQSGVLAGEQHGFRPGRGTESAILHVSNLLSHAHEMGTDLFTTFWDITRAFDSVSKSILKASWVRLGVPEDIANWFVSMDMGGGVIPRSPLASHQLKDHGTASFQHILDGPDTLAFFTTLRGCSQGDPTSPANWTAFFDILLRALQLVDDSPSFYHVTSGVADTGADSAYADDLATVSSTAEGLQAKIDIVSAFASMFGLGTLVVVPGAVALTTSSDDWNQMFGAMLIGAGLVYSRTPTRWCAWCATGSTPPCWRARPGCA
jgi:hypothetical protein